MRKCVDSMHEWPISEFTTANAGKRITRHLVHSEYTDI